MSQKITSFLLIGLIFLGFPASTFGFEGTFSDVGPEEPYFFEIEYLAREGVIEGYENGTFGKDEMANRAELVTMMVRGLGIEPDPSVYRDCFPFVTNEWYAPYVCYAKAQNWISGHADGSFRPGEEASGWEAAKIVINPFFQEEIASQTEEEIKSQMSVGYGVHEDDWYAPYSAFILSKNLGQVNPSNRGWVAELLLKSKLTKELGWPAYHNYFKDEHLKARGWDDLIEADSNGCYIFTEDLSLHFVDEYLQNEYNFDVENQLFNLPRTAKTADLESGNKVYMSHFCVLENDDFKVILTQFPHQSKNESATRHMITFNAEGEKMNEEVRTCSLFGGISTLHNYVVTGIVDPESFEMVDCYYSKDKEYVYSSDDLIEGANPDTFQSLSFPYSKDDERVYCRYWEIEGADAQSFERISATNNINIVNYNEDPFYEAIQSSYAKDNQSIYHSCEPVEGSDVNTFQIIDDFYAKDQNQVYYQPYDFIEIMSADPESFEVLSEYYSKDKDYIYFEGRLIEQANPETFEILDYPYARDSEGVYSGEDLLLNANPQTFSTLDEDSNYSIDGQYVYFGFGLMEGVDLETFEILEDDYSKDKNNVYHYSGIAEISNYFNPQYPNQYDVTSFEVLNEEYTKDMNGVYFRNFPIEEADLETFEPLDDRKSIAKDRNYIFYKSGTLTFELLDLKTAVLVESSILNAYTVKDMNNVYCYVKYYELEESYCEQK